jgi:4-amino-4-deoxy-L-arabinose transferase-like glycosyltransferase
MNMGRNGAIYAIIILSIAVRLFIFAMVRPWVADVEKSVVLQPGIDPIGYHELGVTLASSHRFAYSPTGEPDALRTPLYPLFIALNYWAFGDRPWVVMLSQIALMAISCLILFVIIQHLFGREIAVISSLLFALDPNNIFFCITLFSEILFVFLLVIVLYIYSVIATLKSSTHIKMHYLYGLLGLFLGLSALARPIALYAPILVVILIVARYRKEIRKAIKYSVILLAVFVLSISPWLYRNYVKFGSASLSPVGSHVLLMYNVAYTKMWKSHEDIRTIRQGLNSEAEKLMIADGKQPDQINPFMQAKYWNRLAIKYILNNPIGFAKSYSGGLFNLVFSFWSPTQAKMLRFSTTRRDLNPKAFSGPVGFVEAFFRGKGLDELLVAGVGFIYLFIYYIGFLAGIWAFRGKSHKGFLIFGLLLAIYFCLTGALTGGSRFRLPCMVLTLPLVGIGIYHIYDTIRKKIGFFAAQSADPA